MNISADHDQVAEFNCTANADFINWSVNGSEPPSNDHFIQSRTKVDMSRCLKTASLIINGSSCYTLSVRCFVFSFSKMCHALTNPVTVSVSCKSELSYSIYILMCSETETYLENHAHAHVQVYKTALNPCTSIMHMQTYNRLYMCLIMIIMLVCVCI